MDFLRHIEHINEQKIITDDSILVTMDVTALYTNIPHNEGIAACTEALETRNDPTPPTSFLSKLITLILTLNSFVFNGIHYLQTQGTAMGTSMAPNYANLFFGKLEKIFLESSPLKPTIWLRYIDDIFFIWDHGTEELKTFFELANSFHDTIKFTYQYSLTNIDFLDVTIHKNNNILQTDLYSKPTDAHQYLHWTSCHPPHIRKNLPFGLAYRLRRICSTDTFFIKRLTELKEFLLSRQYKTRIIDEAFEKVKSIPRNLALERKQNKSNSERIPLVVTYHTGLPNLHAILKKNFPILKRSERCEMAIPEIPIIAYRRTRNLRDILVRARLKNPNNTKQPGFYRCGDKRCKTCEYTNDTKSITSSATKRTYDIRQHITCKTRNVIYLITCKRCQKQYTGKTDQKFHKRFNGTRSDICKKNQNKDGPVTRHFTTNGHSVEDIHVTPFDVLPNADTFTLKNKETYWIKTLKTIEPHGINSHKQTIYPIARFT